MRLGAGSAKLPDFPPPEPCESPDLGGKPPLSRAVCRGRGGGYRSAPGYGRREGAADRPGLLSSKGGGWFALPGTPGDVACLGKESFLCVMSEGDG